MRTIRDEDDRDTVKYNDVTVVASTGIAVLCNIQNEEFWVPFSIIEDESEIYKETNGKVMGADSPSVLAVPGWFVKKNGLPEAND